MSVLIDGFRVPRLPRATAEQLRTGESGGSRRSERTVGTATVSITGKQFDDGGGVSRAITLGGVAEFLNVDEARKLAAALVAAADELEGRPL
jgi:hypothetical protein